MKVDLLEVEADECATAETGGGQHKVRSRGPKGVAEQKSRLPQIEQRTTGEAMRGRSIGPPRESQAILVTCSD